ncbi:flagellar M-ring protein FliF [Pantoea agglomerans]|jgi:flagellar M-ring protein FliF|uniref:flagellar basal-body MS-ring/collar protein FliF n=1 Tax=Enterobacter agglomerans TaxID=549 RepID=UPI001053D85F|nr:flagellar basal-body MS-ring/collar protein FliF [Pantoea agglomerans]MDQ0431109.1 flagellar M-ring protein FliF [Pantoea agglomerans]NEG84696.1 flagellar basal body M-ring protein FliF [Pantoea agglomerans]NEH06837.1 flagellar basal body M-ring protein FliF [Pantoea agglomerans]TCZ24216.1 flagellar basal body M-ring protein FliF [Pantoea agglomerans]
MSATLNELKNHPSERIKSLLAQLRASPGLLLIICFSAALSVVIALVFWSREPDYRVLFSNISDEDGGAIVEQLTQLNVPYRVDAQGGVIMVPQTQVHEVRMKLAQQGLPKGGEVGFELLDQEKFGISQFGEQVNYQRALEGELARTIENLGPVRRARVHLAVPKPSMFVREQKEPTASVNVTLINGRSLEDAQVTAITHLISSAVTGLSAENVTLVDQRGTLLTQQGQAGLQTSQLKYTSEIEQDYQERIQRILAPLVGERNIRAQVTAKLDFTQLEQTLEQYQPNADPQKMAIRSRQASMTEQGNGARASGVPGALSNQPPQPSATQVVRPATKTGGGTRAKSDTAQSSADDAAITSAQPVRPYNNRSDETTNFEVDRTLTHTRAAAGRIERLSVAVVINHLPKEGAAKAEPIADAELEKIRDLVKEAVGFEAARGDSVNVLNSPFNGVTEEPEIPLWENENFLSLLVSFARYLAIAIITWVMWRKLVQPAWVGYQETSLRKMEMEKEARDEELAAKKRAADAENRARAQKREDTAINSQQLRELAEKEPRVIALVIRQWMNKEHKS